MKILVCGGRNYLNYEYLALTLDDIIRQTHYPYECTILQGGAKGTDFLAKVYANQWDCEMKEYPANWKKYGKGAGPIRNQQMLDEGKPDLVVAFPGGVGTADMIRRSKKAGIEVIEVGKS